MCLGKAMEAAEKEGRESQDRSQRLPQPHCWWDLTQAGDSPNCAENRLQITVANGAEREEATPTNGKSYLERDTRSRRWHAYTCRQAVIASPGCQQKREEGKKKEEFHIVVTE